MKYLKSVKVPPFEKHIPVNRPSLMTLCCLAGIIVSFAMSACDFREVEAQTAANPKEDKTMESTQSVTTTQRSIPPIDAVTPSQIETATFALG